MLKKFLLIVIFLFSVSVVFGTSSINDFDKYIDMNISEYINSTNSGSPTVQHNNSCMYVNITNNTLFSNKSQIGWGRNNGGTWTSENYEYLDSTYTKTENISNATFIKVAVNSTGGSFYDYRTYSDNDDWVLTNNTVTCTNYSNLSTLSPESIYDGQPDSWTYSGTGNSYDGVLGVAKHQNQRLQPEYYAVKEIDTNTTDFITVKLDFDRTAVSGAGYYFGIGAHTSVFWGAAGDDSPAVWKQYENMMYATMEYSDASIYVYCTDSTYPGDNTLADLRTMDTGFDASASTWYTAIWTYNETNDRVTLNITAQGNSTNLGGGNVTCDMDPDAFYYIGGIGHHSYNGAGTSNGYIDNVNITYDVITYEDLHPVYIFEDQTNSSSCTYSSGDWEVNIEDNCTITTDVDIGVNNLIISGASGFFSVTGSIKTKSLKMKPSIFNGGFIVNKKNINIIK